jgi:hypothetical protein
VQAILGEGVPVYPGYGLLWWRIARSHVRVVDNDQLAMARRAGVDAQLVAALATLKDRPMASDDELEAGLKPALGDDWAAKLRAGRAKTNLWKDHWGDIIGFNTEGYLGEYLIVLPAAELIAVRLVDSHDTYNHDTDGFSDFLTAVRRLVEPVAAGPTN